MSSFTTFLERVEGVIKNDIASLKAFFAGEVWPAFENFLHNTLEEEVKAIVPILEKELPNVVTDLAALLTPGGWAAAAAGLVSTAADAIKQIESKGAEVAVESVHAAVGAVLANAKASVEAMQPLPSAGDPGTPVASGG